MKAEQKRKINLLQQIFGGEKKPNSLLEKPLAKIYTEDVDAPGIYKTMAGQPITKAQMDKECENYRQIIVQVITKGIPPIANSEDEVQLDD